MRSRESPVVRCDHDRENCLEPRCHVLAVCATAVLATPLMPDGIRANTPRWGRYLTRWAQTHHYPIERLEADSPTRLWDTVSWLADRLAYRIATRLVAWMRWDGSRSCDVCEGSGIIAGYVGADDCDSCAGTGRWPSVVHPLDTLAPHHERIRVLASKCPRPDCVELPESKRREHAFGAPCDHDGIRWAAVAVLLDHMEAHGISLDVVHTWRP